MSGGPLNAVYAALDEERYEEALRLCGRSEVAGAPLVRALRSFALAQLDRGQEARALALELLDQQRDEAVLGTVVHTFRALGDQTSLVRCHETLLQLNPSSERHAQQLFFALARAGELKRMQQTASLMYRGLGRRRYLFWTVCCMLTAEPPSPMTLTLAEKMLRKLLYEVFPSARPGFEELRLLVNVILRQDGADRALTAIDELSSRPSGPPPSDQDSEQEVDASALQMHELRCEVLRRSGDSRGELRELAALLAHSPDQWTAYTRAVDLLCGPLAKDEEARSSHLLLVQSLQRTHPALRGPWLAEVHLSCALSSDDRLIRRLWGEDSSACSVLTRALHSYVDKFGDRQCCYSDVRPFVETLVKLAEERAVFEWLEGEANEATNRLDTCEDIGLQKNMLTRVVNLTQLRYLCNQLAGECDYGAVATNALQLYKLTTKKVALSESSARETRPDDELLLLATAALREMVVDTTPAKFSILFESAMLAEYGCKESPHSYCLKLDQIKLCRDLGAGVAAMNLFNSFSIRYIQLDSLSFLVTPLLMELGLFNEVRFLCTVWIIFLISLGYSNQ